jgi:hypothetical protein
MDAGIQQISTVSDLRAKSYKADNKVLLTWKLPIPVPDSIEISRNGNHLKTIAGACTSYEDKFFFLGSPEGIVCPYAIQCHYYKEDKLLQGFSDFATVSADIPLEMENDDFHIRNFLLGNPRVGKESLLHSFFKNGGTDPVTWRIKEGKLPPGLMLNTNYKQPQLSGVPITAGTYAFAVEVTDATGATASKEYLLSVLP